MASGTVWPQEGFKLAVDDTGSPPQAACHHVAPFKGQACRAQCPLPEAGPQSCPSPELLLAEQPRSQQASRGFEQQSTYYFARGAGGFHADAKLAVQIDYGVVDEGEDFQLNLGLVGVPVLNHIRVCVGDGAAGRRARTHQL